MDKIVDLCHQYGLKLVEDCAQSHGALFGNRMTGSFGDIGCFSFYPSKNRVHMEMVEQWSPMIQS